MKLSPHPNGCGRCAASRLSTPLSTILTALLLFACVSAQAQWTRGNTYFGASTVTQADSHTTVTKTADSGSGTGTGGLNSVPTNDYNGYMASGKLYGYVYQDFNWGGQSPKGLWYYSAESISGSIPGYNGSASSSLDHTSGATSYPYTLSYSSSSPFTGGGYSSDAPPATYTAKDWMQVATTAYYPSSATAKATVVFSVYSP